MTLLDVEGRPVILDLPDRFEVVSARCGLEYNARREQYRLCGQILRLAKRLQAILDLLRRYPYRVLTHEQIAVHTRGSDWDGCADAINSYMSQLRTAMDPHGDALIVNRRGIGFVFQP